MAGRLLVRQNACEKRSISHAIRPFTGQEPDQKEEFHTCRRAPRLIQDGFIAAAPAGSPVAPPAPADPAAAPLVTDAAAAIDPEKLRVAKVAMRQHIKLAAGAMAAKSLHKLVDDTRGTADLAACLEKLCHEFEGKGFSEAAQNLRAQVDPLLG